LGVVEASTDDVHAAVDYPRIIWLQRIWATKVNPTRDGAVLPVVVVDDRIKKCPLARRGIPGTGRRAPQIEYALPTDPAGCRDQLVAAATGSLGCGSSGVIVRCIHS
jgi:hypothetical protein